MAEVFENAPRLVRAAVIYHDNFMGDVVEAQLQIQVFDRGPDAPGFVARRNNNR